MEPFIHLHVHTQYSLLDGQASIDALIDKAQKDGMPAIAVTDHGVMFGIKEFFNKVSKKNSKPKGAIKDLEKELKGLKSKEELTAEEQTRIEEIPSQKSFVFPLCLEIFSARSQDCGTQDLCRGL